MNTINRIILIVSRIVFGLTFLFSGFVKAVDPMGSAFKFMDYFRAFDLTWLNNLAVFLAIVLAAVEFSIGASILLGSYRRLSTLLGLIFMCVFTPLTLYLAIENPVKDCGCFGDAIILTNWQTFYKNLILLVLSIYLFVNKKHLIRLFGKTLNWVPGIYAFVFSVFISLIALNHLPIIDFRPYKPGVNIEEDMQPPAEAPKAEHILVYEKDGVKKDFTLENYPADDDSWKFVESKTIMPEGNWQPKIADFFILNESGDNVTMDILNSDYTFLLISPDLDKAKDNHIEKINNLYDYAEENDYNFYCVTTEDPEKIYAWRESTGAEYEFLYSDATILETIIRANPGIVLLHNGTIIWKANVNAIPDKEELILPLDQNNLGIIKKNNDNNTILFVILIFFCPILVLLLFEKSVVRILKNSKRKN